MHKIFVDMDVLRSLITNGFQASKIANHFKISAPTVKRICKENKLFHQLKANGIKANQEHCKVVRFKY